MCNAKYTARQQFPSLRRIAEACRPGGDGRVVDAGCGTGALVPFLKEAGVPEGDVVGIDVSPEVRYAGYSGIRLGVCRQNVEIFFFFFNIFIIL